MAHILTIIPKGFRIGKKVQTLSCISNSTKNIQNKIDCAANLRQQLDNDIFERENSIKQSAILKQKNEQ